MHQPAPVEASIHDFVGSARVFASAVVDVVEKRVLDSVDGPRLTHSQFTLLRMVAITEAQTISDVAVFLGVSNAAASKAVDKLVRRKLLRRQEGHPDRRKIKLSLTDGARALLVEYDAAKRTMLARVFRRASAVDLRRASRLLDRLSAALVDHAEDPDAVCLQCGIYFRDRCLVRQLANRNCFYRRGDRRPAVERA